MNDQPLLQFDSHIAGKNATVRLYPDRVEWGKKGWMSTTAKAGLGVATMGLSLVATGVRGKSEENILPIRSITSVNSKKDGLTKTKVQAHTSSGVVEFRCSGAEAERFKSLLLQQMANGGQDPRPQQAPAPQVQPTPPPTAGNPVMEQLQQLGSLRDSGILSEEEFQAKKIELLGKL